MLHRRQRPVEDFADEIEAHLQIEADRLIEEEGMEPDEARQAARRAFGNLTKSRETFYESGRWLWLDDGLRDLRVALRQLIATPVSTATIIVSLALGIGANTAIFSLADQALLRALPVPSPTSLVHLEWSGRFIGGGVGSGDMPHALFRELSATTGAFDGMFASHPTLVHLKVGDKPEPTMAEIVSGSYFPTLGVGAALGRLLDENDDLEPSAHPVAVISFELWQRRFAFEPGVIGRQVELNNTLMTIVGVAQQGFHGLDWGMAPGIWVPIMMKREATPGWDALDDRRTRWLNVFARLKPGSSTEQIESRLQPWFRAYLDADTRRDGWPEVTEAQMAQYLDSRLRVLPADRGISVTRRRVQRPLLVLFAATFLVLLLACLNVANLSLATALSRRRATAMRIALGASRARIVSEGLMQSALLAVAGCVLGAAIALPLGSLILSFLPEQASAATAIGAVFDLRVFLFALVVTSVVTVLAGAAPVVYQSRIEPGSVLKQSALSISGGLGLRRALVVGQFTLALLLLVGAGLFSRTLQTLQSVGPGFSTTNLLMFRVDPLSQGYEAEEAKVLIREVLRELETAPEVRSAGVGRWEMLKGSGWSNPVTVAGRDRIVTDVVGMNAVSPGFFDVLGAPVLHGRDFTERDVREQPGWGLRSVIVNDEFVRRYLPEGNPIGLRLAIGDTPDLVPEIEIVGVVRSFSDYTLRESRGQVFFPLWERSVGEGTFYVRTRGSSNDAVRSIRSIVHGLDPTLTVQSMRTVADQLDRLLVNERMLATLATAFASAATLLAAIGLYAVLAFSAALRSKEIGIRLALGAPRWSAQRLMAREALSMALRALAFALPGCWLLGQLVESQLFGVDSADPPTLAGAAAVLLVVSGVATLVAARKATARDVLQALRLD